MIPFNQNAERVLREELIRNEILDPLLHHIFSICQSETEKALKEPWVNTNGDDLRPHLLRTSSNEREALQPSEERTIGMPKKRKRQQDTIPSTQPELTTSALTPVANELIQIEPPSWIFFSAENANGSQTNRTGGEKNPRLGGDPIDDQELVTPDHDKGEVRQQKRRKVQRVPKLLSTVEPKPSCGTAVCSVSETDPITVRVCSEEIIKAHRSDREKDQIQPNVALTPKTNETVVNSEVGEGHGRQPMKRKRQIVPENVMISSPNPVANNLQECDETRPNLHEGKSGNQKKFLPKEEDGMGRTQKRRKLQVKNNNLNQLTPAIHPVVSDEINIDEIEANTPSEDTNQPEENGAVAKEAVHLFQLAQGRDARFTIRDLQKPQQLLNRDTDGIENNGTAPNITDLPVFPFEDMEINQSEAVDNENGMNAVGACGTPPVSISTIPSQPEKVHTFVCRICETPLGTGVNLRRHEAVAHEEPTVSCPECYANGKEIWFSSYQSLKFHRMRVHFPAWEANDPNRSASGCHSRPPASKESAVCTWEGCSRILSNVSNMRRHIQIVHLQKKPHSCSICGKSFGTKANWDVHIKLQHTDQVPAEEGGAGTIDVEDPDLVARDGEKEGASQAEPPGPNFIIGREFQGNLQAEDPDKLFPIHEEDHDVEDPQNPVPTNTEGQDVRGAGHNEELVDKILADLKEGRI